MKAKLLGLVLLSACAAAALATEQKEHKGKPMEGKSKPACLMMIKDANYKVTNTANGVTIEITSADAATVKIIQEKAAKAGKGCECGKHGDKKGPCPMGDKAEGKNAPCPDKMKKEHSCPMAEKAAKGAKTATEKTEAKPAETTPATGK